MAANIHQNTPLQYRIGDTFTIAWPILTNGEETPLAGRDLELWLQDSIGRKTKVEDWTAIDNVLYFTFQGRDQKCTGTYRMTLYENSGKMNQHVIDLCYAFKLLSCSCGTKGMKPTPDYLEQMDMMAGYKGESAYEIAVRYGFEGTEQEWVESLHTEDIVARQMAQTATETANESKTIVEVLRERVEELAGKDFGMVDTEQIVDGAVTTEKINQSAIATFEDVDSVLTI